MMINVYANNNWFRIFKHSNRFQCLNIVATRTNKFVRVAEWVWLVTGCEIARAAVLRRRREVLRATTLGWRREVVGTSIVASTAITTFIPDYGFG